MRFYGDLEDLPLHDTLYVLSSKGKSGLLTLRTAGDEITLLFDRGAVTPVGSSDGSLRIGQLLVDQGYVTDEQIEQALALQAVSTDTDRIGDVLVDVGYVTPQQIHVAVAAQLGACIFRILVQNGGTFEFERLNSPREQPLASGIQLEPMVLNAMRLADEWLDTHRPDAVLVLPDELIDPSVFDDLVDAERRPLIAALNGITALVPLARRTRLSASALRTAIDRLVEHGLVRIERPGAPNPDDDDNGDEMPSAC
jgi:hypothetical protein